CALGIDEAPSHVESGSRITGAVSHGQGAGVDGAKTLGVSLQQQLALVVPELDKLLRILLDHADVEGRGHIGEALTHPLVAAGSESDRVPPPLMRYFVGRDHFPISAVTPVQTERMANG